MSLYLDTSVIVAALTNESASARVAAWLGRGGEAQLSISLWVTVEFASALALKRRTGQLNSGNRAAALAQFTRMAAENLTFLPISDLDFQAAARFLDKSTRGLRAGDALHLAVASRHSETLCTLDHRLVEAGTELGTRTLLV